MLLILGTKSWIKKNVFDRALIEEGVLCLIVLALWLQFHLILIDVVAQDGEHIKPSGSL